jgi:hypothetical protein
VPSDANDLDDDGDTSELVPLDFDGSARFTDDSSVADTGCGAPVVVDMGAFERTGAPAPGPLYLGDIDGSGGVGINDFLALLAEWGPCDDQCCLADLNLDGTVGIDDFLILLASWTPAG